MSGDPKIWPVILVAAIMVLSVTAVMFIGAENEPSGPFGPMPPHYGTGCLLITTPVSQVGELPPLFALSSPLRVMFSSGYLLDLAIIETTWGEKAVERSIGPAFLKDGMGITVFYLGVETSLTYRMDVIGQDYRLTYLLSDTNFTEIKDMDPADEYQPQVQVYKFALSQGETNNMNQGGMAFSIWEPAEGKDLRFKLNLTEYSFVLMNESMVWTMLDGGLLLYDEQRSFSGNGTLEFTVEEGWFFWYLGQNYDRYGSGWMQITAYDE